MKMMKRVAVLACLICALTTVICFANGLEFTSTEMGDDNKVVVSFYPTEAFNAGYITTKITFNKDAWTISNISGAAFTDKSATGEIGIGKTDFIETEYSPSTPILSFTAVLNEGFDVAENPFTLVKPTVANADFSNSLAMEGADIILTVTKKTTEVNPGATAGEKLTGGLTYQTKEGERKFVANNFAISNFDKIGTKKFRVTYTPVYADATTPVNPKSFDYSINTEELTGTVTFTAALYDIPERVSDVNMSAEFVD